MGTIGRSLPLEEDIGATLKLLGVMRAHKVRPLCICVGGDVLVLNGGRGGWRAGERGRRAGQLAREPLLGAAPEPHAVSKLQLPRG